MGVNYGKDHFNKKARKEGYRARSVYKLQEIQNKYHILKRGMKVVDLGAAPGSWSQYLAEEVGPSGRVYGLDISPMDPSMPSHVELVQGDVFEADPAQIREHMGGRVPVVVSDMAPRTSGVRQVDHLRSIALCERARDLASGLLLPQGAFVVKIFEGGDAQGYIKSLRPLYASVKRVKPKSSKKDSVEFFVVALGFKGVEESVSESDGGPVPVQVKAGGYDPFADM